MLWCNYGYGCNGVKPELSKLKLNATPCLCSWLCSWTLLWCVLLLWNACVRCILSTTLHLLLITRHLKMFIWNVGWEHFLWLPVWPWTFCSQATQSLYNPNMSFGTLYEIFSINFFVFEECELGSYKTQVACSHIVKHEAEDALPRYYTYEYV